MAEELIDRIERVLRELIPKLESDLKKISLKSVLDHYQALLDFSQIKIDEFPDGFWAKWRYIWALRLRWASEGSAGEALDFEKIDKQIEEIFDVYSVGAIYDHGKEPRSETEFLARLGLAMKVREIANLSFPEQFRSRMEERFRLFDESYFLPSFGVTFHQIMTWLDEHVSALEEELNKRTNELIELLREMDPFRIEFANGKIDLEQMRAVGIQNKWERRLEENGKALHKLHTYSKESLRRSLSATSVDALISEFQLEAKSDSKLSLLYPHSENPLRKKFLIRLSDDHWQFIDPSLIYKVCSKAFEDNIFSNDDLKTRYLRNRDDTTETRVAEALRKLAPEAEIYQNFYTERRSHEKDIFFRVGRTVVLVECKNSKIRNFGGKSSDLIHFKDDFKRSVQYGFGQALGAKEFILGSDEVIFLDSKGRPYFTANRDQIDRIYIVCIADNPRGPLGTDLSYFLEKKTDEPFPLALRLFDFETICKHMPSADRLIDYLCQRDKLHGHTKTGDELNYAGYFLRYGNLKLARNTMVDDSNSQFFDDEWYRQKGIPIERNYPEKPFLSEMRREGNTITFKNQSTGEILDTIDIEPGHPAYAQSLAHKMIGRNRNTPCPCGSGRKFKKCHGSF